MKNSIAVLIMLVLINIIGFFVSFQDSVIPMSACIMACTYWIVKTIEDIKTV